MREEQQPNAGSPQRGNVGDTDTKIGILSPGENPCICVLVVGAKFPTPMPPGVWDEIHTRSFDLTKMPCIFTEL